jgi:phosphatidylglycerophosphatase A
MGLWFSDVYANLKNDNFIAACFLPFTIKRITSLIKSRRIRWLGHVKGKVIPVQAVETLRFARG